MATHEGDPHPETPPTRSSDRTVWYIVGALVVLWFGYLALFGPRMSGLGGTPPLLADPMLGQADFSWSLQTLDGTAVELSEYRGRPIVLNLWATWCGPCVAEMPSLHRLASNPALQSVAVLAVSHEDTDTIRSFAAREKSPLTFLRSPGFPPPMFLADAIPTTFLIAPSGRVAAMHLGAAQWDDPSVVSFLQDLEREAKPSAE